MRDNGGPGRRRKEAGSLSLRLADLPGGGGWLGHVAIKGEEARERERERLGLYTQAMSYSITGLSQALVLGCTRCCLR